MYLSYWHWVIVPAFIHSVDHEVPLTKGWKALYVFVGVCYRMFGVWLHLSYKVHTVRMLATPNKERRPCLMFS